MKLQTFLLALSLTGCIDDGNDPEIQGDDASFYLSLHSAWSWTSGTPVTLQSTSINQTCWLDGVGGDFTGQPFVSQIPTGGDLPSIKARARTFFNASLGKWQIVANPGTGTGVEAQVLCANVAYNSNRVHELAWQDNLGGNLEGMGANTQCYLRDIWATSGLSPFAEIPFTPQIVLSRTQTGSTFRWNFQDSFVTNAHGDHDFGGATMVCIDMPAGAGLWSYGFVGGDNKFLRDSYPSGAKVPSGTVGCGISGVRGFWNGGGFGNGGFLDDSTDFWKVSVAAGGRAIDVRCAQ